MRKWIGLLVFVALLTGVDIGARTIAAEQLERRAQDEAPRGTEASASISSFPFLGRLLVLSDMRRVGIELRNVAAPGLVFSRVHLDLRGVSIDRGRLISDQDAEITDIDSGVVTVEVSQEALSEKLGVPVVIASGRVTATVGGQQVSATASVDEGVLVLDVGPLPPLRAAIPTTNYAPCVGDLTLLAGRARFRCTIDEVPPALVGVARSVT